MLSVANIDKILEKVYAVDLDMVMKVMPFVPALGKEYTRKDLELWRDKRITALKNLTLTDEISLSSIQSYVKSIIPEGVHLLSEEILEQGKHQGELEYEWDELIQLRLLQFADLI